MPPLLRDNVDSICKARGLSKQQLAQRLQRARVDIDKALNKENPPKTLLKELADELVVPDFAFFMADPPLSAAIIDFRDADPSRTAYQKSTLKAIEAGRNIRSVADCLAKPNTGTAIWNLAEGLTHSERAKSLRLKLEISSQDQLEAKDARVFYGLVRKKIESTNIFVTQYSFHDGAGFCLTSQRGFDYICINTRRQTYQRRLFTLVHEVYHCILNQTGLSDPEVIRNKIERECNSFSAEFLAPDDLIKGIYRRFISSRSFDLNEAKNLAQALKISIHASIIRLVNLNIYDTEAISAWSAFRKGHSNPDSIVRSGGRRVEEWKYKLAKHSFKFADVFKVAVNEGLVDDLDVFRLSRIKPQYQVDYFHFASSARPEDVEDE